MDIRSITTDPAGWACRRRELVGRSRLFLGRVRSRVDRRDRVPAERLWTNLATPGSDLVDLLRLGVFCVRAFAAGPDQRRHAVWRPVDDPRLCAEAVRNGLTRGHQRCLAAQCPAGFAAVIAGIGSVPDCACRVSSRRRRLQSEPSVDCQRPESGSRRPGGHCLPWPPARLCPRDVRRVVLDGPAGHPTKPGLGTPRGGRCDGSLWRLCLLRRSHEIVRCTRSKASRTTCLTKALSRRRRDGTAEFRRRGRPLRPTERDYQQNYLLSEWQLPEKPELLISAAANVSKFGAAPTGQNVLPFVISAKEIRFTNGRTLTPIGSLVGPGAGELPVTGEGMGFRTKAERRSLGGRARLSAWHDGRRNLKNLTFRLMCDEWSRILTVDGQAHHHTNTHVACTLQPAPWGLATEPGMSWRSPSLRDRSLSRLRTPTFAGIPPGDSSQVRSST